MMETLKISGLNFDISWKDKADNFIKINELSTSLSSDLLILPEMFSTGFYMKAEEIADRKQETLNWMNDLSAKKNMAVCGSASVFENGHYYNR
ncbi:MAG: nitrilase-related carbon-nitrogen hydrolase, partial [Kaistella sp.]